MGTKLIDGLFRDRRLWKGRNALLLITGTAFFVQTGELLEAQTEAPTQSPTPPITVSAKLSSNENVQGVIDRNGDETILKTKTGESYTLGNDQTLPQISEPFPLHLKLAKIKHGEHKIEKTSIKSAGEWHSDSERIVDPKANPQLKQLDTTTEELNNVVTANLIQRRDDQNLPEVIEKYKETRKVVESVYLTVTDKEVLGALLELKKNLEEEQRLFFFNKLLSEGADGSAHTYLKNAPLIEKRFYRLNDNYRPEVYEMICKLCSSCVAIVRVGTDGPLGSGVVVGKNLVLTCAHNIKLHRADSFATSEYDVWFDYEERLFSSALTPVKYQSQEVYRSKELDFVLLEIQPLQGPDLSERKPIPLSTIRVERWTPIFLVGHPQGIRRMVHDGAWVLFPYELTNEERGQVQSELATQLVDWTEQGEVNAKKEKGFMKAKDFMERNYGLFQNGGSVSYRYMNEGKPSIGAECDTFSGDSGAPALLRETGKLIGMLYKGMPDIPGQTAATNRRNPEIFGTAGPDGHELLLPAETIIADIKQGFPTWKDRGIKIEK